MVRVERNSPPLLSTLFLQRRRKKKLATAISGSHPRSMCHRSVDNCKPNDRQTFNGVLGHGLARHDPLFVLQTAANRFLRRSVRPGFNPRVDYTIRAFSIVRDSMSTYFPLFLSVYLARGSALSRFQGQLVFHFRSNSILHGFFRSSVVSLVLGYFLRRDNRREIDSFEAL